MGLPQNQELGYASRQVNSIEINGTFYSLQRATSYASWYKQVPDDFVFSIKGPRFITHILRLRDARVPLANFFASGVLRLGEKLGPLLWQLPPSLRYDRKLVQEFFDLLPRDAKAAAVLGRRHDEHLRSPAWTKVEKNRPLRHAIEVRHDSFHQPEFVRLARENEIAIVVADTAGKWPQIEEETADFVYARLHGAEELYASGYTPEALTKWARKFRSWNRKRDIFVYFDNDIKVRAPFDAMSLARRLSRNVARTGG
ncbi:MAG TPA: DUF72 domain-containing protein [Opitutaceae bacterium]